MKNKTKLVCVSLLFLHKASVFNLPDLPRPGQKKKNENVLEKCFFLTSKIKQILYEHMEKKSAGYVLACAVIHSSIRKEVQQETRFD